MNITIAGLGYVGLSNAVLLARNNKVTAVDLSSERVDLVNSKKSPIVDVEIEEFLATKELDLNATIDTTDAYKHADYVIIATPTNYDEESGEFDTSSVDSVIELATRENPDATIIVKSRIIMDQR